MQDTSLIEDEAPRRWQQAVGIIPREGLGVGRRAFLLAMIAWLPLAVWAIIKGRAFPGQFSEPLLGHYGVHIRCLLAIPLFVMAEGTVHGATRDLLAQLLRRGVVREDSALQEAVGGVLRLRRQMLPWIIVAAVTLAWIVLPETQPRHELLWADEGHPSPLSHGFGGWWFLYVSRTIYVALGFGWFWRLLLLGILLRRIAKLDLNLVPTHPDGFAGLGPIARIPAAFAPVILAVSAVLASGWAHNVVFHGVTLASLRIPALSFLAIMLVLFISPVLSFTPVLTAARRVGLQEYGELIARHGRGVRERWIKGQAVPDDGLLAAPEIGPVADTIALYDAVWRIRPVLVNKATIATVLGAIIIPLIAVIAIRVPVGNLLLGLLKALA